LSAPSFFFLFSPAEGRRSLSSFFFDASAVRASQVSPSFSGGKGRGRGGLFPYFPLLGSYLAKQRRPFSFFSSFAYGGFSLPPPFFSCRRQGAGLGLVPTPVLSSFFLFFPCPAAGRAAAGALLRARGSVFFFFPLKARNDFSPSSITTRDFFRAGLGGCSFSPPPCWRTRACRPGRMARSISLSSLRSGRSRQPPFSFFRRAVRRSAGFLSFFTSKLSGMALSFFLPARSLQGAFFFFFRGSGSPPVPLSPSFFCC